MFKKRNTPSSSKSASPVPLEFESDHNDMGEDSIVNENINFSPPIEVNVNVNVNEEPEAMPSALSNDPTENPSIHYEYTQRHPLGQILMKLLHENTKLAEKVHLKGMEMSVDELCTNFYNHQLSEKQKINSKIMQTTANLENSIISKEMNSHIINQSIAPPQHFSPVPTLLTARQRADCMKLLPMGSNKFSGSERGTSIVEFLHMLNMIQKNCNLSLPEFYEIMLSSTTGQAYLLIHSWIEGGDDPETIYHNLLVHYDKRLQPEEARVKLMNYRAPRNSDLAKVEATIQGLAARAATNVPPGPSRTANYNMEVVQALVRSLPPASSLIVQNTKAEKSARLGRSITAAELSRFLNIYRHTIDNDIKAHGVDPREGLATKRVMFRAGNNGARKNSAYGVRIDRYGEAPTHHKSQASQVPNSTNYGHIYQVSHNPGGSKSPRQLAEIKRQNAEMKKAWYEKYGDRIEKQAQNTSGRFNNRQRGSFQRKPFRTGSNFTPQGNSRHYCSLCGKRDHTAISGCPNMKSDSGAPVSILPCKDTCNACPPYVKPRLSHPEYLCPYRKGGPWGKQ